MSQTLRIVSEGGDPAPPWPDPIGQMTMHQRAQHALCDLLEAIADSLPDAVSRDQTQQAARALRCDFLECLTFEGRIFVPLLRRRAGGHPWLGAALDLLESEQVTDRFYGEEVADALDLHASAGPAFAPEALGYMLRGFFQARRRQLEWMGAVLLPEARVLVTAEDIQELAT